MEFSQEIPEAGKPVAVARGVARLVAPNPGPFTYSGTCSYVVGQARCIVIDPGPDDAAHLDALMAVIEGRAVEAILLTHTHKDHSPLALTLSKATGAPVMSGGPHRPARAPRGEETLLLDASADLDHRPDRLLEDGEELSFDGRMITVLATPGHTMNHLCFALDEDLLFSGDHVMAWSTSIVAPPDGAMNAYLASLRKLIALGDRFGQMLPGHGGPVQSPLAFMRALLQHRQQREASILARLAAGDRTTAEIVAATYLGLDKRLILPARLSVLAHLEALIEQGVVAAEGEAGLEGSYRLT
jgi:glyoxylase-like metal-dependent hydrolase (beta-lactamase superfamily II)